jgi:8-oxo-dGTP pyrophosphatase MutT (NUDIX family)
LLRRGWLPISFALADLVERLRARLPEPTPRQDGDPSLIWAAVAVVLAPSPDAILLIRRSERFGDPWSGHMALPGGRQDPNDSDLLSTAVRETREEVGVQLASHDLVGSLSPVIPRTPVLPPIAIQPFVFLLRQRPSLVPNPEVASAAWIEIDQLLDPLTYGEVELKVGGIPRFVWAYRLEHGVVWGLTERILSSLLGK